jgi:hypothetical protein
MWPLRMGDVAYVPDGAYVVTQSVVLLVIPPRESSRETNGPMLCMEPLDG